MNNRITRIAVCMALDLLPSKQKHQVQGWDKWFHCYSNNKVSKITVNIKNPNDTETNTAFWELVEELKKKISITVNQYQTQKEYRHYDPWGLRSAIRSYYIIFQYPPITVNHVNFKELKGE